MLKDVVGDVFVDLAVLPGEQVAELAYQVIGPVRLTGRNLFGGNGITGYSRRIQRIREVSVTERRVLGFPFKRANDSL